MQLHVHVCTMPCAHVVCMHREVGHCICICMQDCQPPAIPPSRARRGCAAACLQPGKCLYTTIRELVENALDAAESISQLPNIEITM